MLLKLTLPVPLSGIIQRAARSTYRAPRCCRVTHRAATMSVPSPQLTTPSVAAPTANGRRPNAPRATAAMAFEGGNGLAGRHVPQLYCLAVISRGQGLAIRAESYGRRDRLWRFLIDFGRTHHLRWPNRPWPGEKTAYFSGKTGHMARHGIWPSDASPRALPCLHPHREVRPLGLARRVLLQLPEHYGDRFLQLRVLAGVDFGWELLDFHVRRTPSFSTAQPPFSTQKSASRIGRLVRQPLAFLQPIYEIWSTARGGPAASAN